jgi:cytochrome-b5 reductase
MLEAFGGNYFTGAAALVAITSLLLCFVVSRLLRQNQVAPAMDAQEFKLFRLSKKEIVSHDTRRFTFDLQTPQTKLGLPIGQHISFRFTDSDGKSHQRSYTPVTGDELLGKVTFVIKVYKAGVHPKFPDGGKMSQHLDSLKIGDATEMRGPKGHMDYMGKGKFTLKLIGKPIQHRSAKHFGMICGGTGITPMLQVINAVIRDTKDTSITISLLYANQSEDDILLRQDLELLEKQYPTRFKLHYTLDRPPAQWGYFSGFVNEAMIRSSLPSPSKDGTTQILMCGPPPMIKFACIPNLEALGFTEDEWVSF